MPGHDRTGPQALARGTSLFLATDRGGAVARRTQGGAIRRRTVGSWDARPRSGAEHGGRDPGFRKSVRCRRGSCVFAWPGADIIRTPKVVGSNPTPRFELLTLGVHLF